MPSSSNILEFFECDAKRKIKGWFFFVCLFFSPKKGSLSERKREEAGGIFRYRVVGTGGDNLIMLLLETVLHGFTHTVTCRVGYDQNMRP